MYFGIGTLAGATVPMVETQNRSFFKNQTGP